ncbi:MAG: dTDP-4-dehydrorhamnose reductase [Pseudohongiellaceae bacterium]
MTGTIVVTGATGQLGQTLTRRWAEAPIAQFSFIALDRSALDLAEPDRMAAVLNELKPAVIVNAAAYTQVDKAESDSAAAYAVNDSAVAAMAAWAAHNGAKILHISTDFVFDGAGTSPYLPSQQPKPLGVYGASKLAGEKQLMSLAEDCSEDSSENCSAIIRTSWLYSEYGNNFLKTMLSLMAAREELAVVSDQLGSPTSTHSLAQLLFAMIQRGEYSGIYHWSDGASISWFEFAREIQRQALQKGLLAHEIPIRPITSSEYPTAAQRPAYSVLDRGRAQAQFDCPAQDWKQLLSAVLDKLVQG